jgi:hypothetical protein
LARLQSAPRWLLYATMSSRLVVRIIFVSCCVHLSPPLAQGACGGGHLSTTCFNFTQDDERNCDVAH